MDRFELSGELIADGAYGTLRRARDTQTGLLQAVKSIRKTASGEASSQFQIVYQDISQLKHPNLAQILAHFEDSGHFYIVSPLCEGGELLSAVNEGYRLGREMSEAWAANAVNQLCSALSFCHSAGVVHASLKSGNIMLRNSTRPGAACFESLPQAFITDLGTAEMVVACGQEPAVLGLESLSTRAPEDWEGTRGAKCDVWSLGCVLFELFTGQLAFRAAGDKAAWVSLYSQGPDWSLSRNVSEEGKHLCRMMLVVDEFARPTAEKCLKHPWFKLASTGLSAGDVKIQRGVCHHREWTDMQKQVCLALGRDFIISGKVANAFRGFDPENHGAISKEIVVAALLSLELNEATAVRVAAALDRGGECEYLEFVAGCLTAMGADSRALWERAQVEESFAPSEMQFKEPSEQDGSLCSVSSAHSAPLQDSGMPEESFQPSENFPEDAGDQQNPAQAADGMKNMVDWLESSGPPEEGSDSCCSGSGFGSVDGDVEGRQAPEQAGSGRGAVESVEGDVAGHAASGGVGGGQESIHASEPDVRTPRSGSRHAVASPRVSEGQMEEADKGSVEDGASASLYDRLGGEQTLVIAVDVLFAKLADDWRIGHFFQGADLDRLKPGIRSFLASALGGPEYSGPDLATGHTHLKLTENDFDALGESLILTLAGLDVPSDLSEQVCAVVNSVREQVIGFIAAAAADRELEMQSCQPVSDKAEAVSAPEKDAAVEHSVAEMVSEEDVIAVVVDEPSLFDRLGGADALVAIMDLMFEKMIADPRVSHMLQALNPDSLKPPTINFLTAALGGPASESAAAKAAFGSLSMVDGFFDAFEEALVAALEQLGNPSDLSAEVAAVAAALKHDNQSLIPEGTVMLPTIGDTDFGEVDPTAAAGGVAAAAAGTGNIVADEKAKALGIVTDSLEELVLDPNHLAAVQRTWKTIIRTAGSREIVGEALYDALFMAAPSLIYLFKSPKAVTAVKFASGLDQIQSLLDDGPGLKACVEDLAFRHLMFEITPPRICLFRDAVIDLLEVELADNWSDEAFKGWQGMMNYCGGAMIFIKNTYSKQLKILRESWEFINRRGTGITGQEGGDAGDQDTATARYEAGKGGNDASKDDVVKKKGRGMRLVEAIGSAKKAKSVAQQLLKAKEVATEGAGSDTKGAGGGVSSTANSGGTVPTSFDDMLHFNATVMGCGESAWLKDILASFDGMVTNVANNTRLQEEGEIVALKLSKHPAGVVDLNVFKACMLASLRSLLPRQWDSAHEVAWSWLWENIEKILNKNSGLPNKYEKVLTKFMSAMNSEESAKVGQAIYARFFHVAPGGQHFFKQSNSRLVFITDAVLEFTLTLYQTPLETVNNLCALGLRHVGYNIPIEFFAPFVTSCCDVVREKTNDDMLVESFLWTLSLTAKIMVRTITEGRTVVMMAINNNSPKQLVKSLDTAPRCKRTTWLLKVQVGQQRISPLLWAIDTGYLEVAKAILLDLLTIRADRDRYYYGLDELFRRHPDIVKRFVGDAPSMLPLFLEGLIWRSRHAQDGKRRVNYYVKHLLVNKDGQFSDALKSVVAARDPVLISHPVLILVSDTLWGRIVCRQFISGQLWFIFSLLVFMCSQAILPKFQQEGVDNDAVRYLILLGRAELFLYALPRLLYFHSKNIFMDYWKKQTISVSFLKLPRYWQEPHDVGSLVLTVLLVLMVTHESAIWCGLETFLSESCQPEMAFRYSVFSMWSMILFWLLIMNLSVFSTSLSAFTLVGAHVMSEVGRFLAALLLLLLAFSSGVAALGHSHSVFRDVPNAMLSMFAITIGLYEIEDEYDRFRREPALFIAILLFMAICVVLLLNLLIAQLNCSYGVIFQDMVGYARLHRASLIVKSLALCTEKRWNIFVQGLKLDQKLELNEGDLGPAPGIQVLETANANSGVDGLDNIRRFGGDTSVMEPWPQEAGGPRSTDDRIDSLESLTKKILRKVSQGDTGGKAAKGAAGSGMASSNQQSSSNGESGDGDDD